MLEDSVTRSAVFAFVASPRLWLDSKSPVTTTIAKAVKHTTATLLLMRIGYFIVLVRPSGSLTLAGFYAYLGQIAIRYSDGHTR